MRILLIFSLSIVSFLKGQGVDTIRISISTGQSNDYTGLFQQALNTRNGKAVKIIVRKGVYKISKNLYTTRPHTFMSFEQGATLQFTSEKSSGIAVLHDYFKISGAQLVGNRLSAKDFYTGYGILLNGVSHCKILNCKFEGISGNNILFYPTTKGCSNNIVQGNSIKNPAFSISKNGDESAIMMGYSGKGYLHNDNLIADNIIDGADFLKIGIGFIGHGNRNIIRNNKVSNFLAYGIVSYESQVDGNTMLENQIIDNVVMNIGEIGSATTVKGMGIYLMTSVNALVSGNKIYNVLRNSDQTETLAAGGIAVSLSPGAVVRDNFIDGSYMYGIVAGYSFGSKFLGNRIQNTRKSGAFFKNMNNVEVSNNIFKNIGAVVLRGYFENTSLPYILEQMREDKYKYISTGNNFKITGNKFYTDKDVLYFVGSTVDKTRPFGNKIKNNIVENNEVIGNLKKQENLFNFRQEVSGSNKVRRNKILK